MQDGDRLHEGGMFDGFPPCLPQRCPSSAGIRRFFWKWPYLSQRRTGGSQPSPMIWG